MYVARFNLQTNRVISQLRVLIKAKSVKKSQMFTLRLHVSLVDGSRLTFLTLQLSMQYCVELLSTRDYLELRLWEQRETTTVVG